MIDENQALFQEFESFVKIQEIDNPFESPHMHPQYELIYVLSGNLHLDIGPRAFFLQPGDLAFISRNLVHAYRTQHKSCCLMVWIGSFALPMLAVRLLRHEVREPVVSLRDDMEEAQNCAKRLMAETAGRADRDVLLGYVQILLGRAFERFILSPSTGGEDSLAAKALSYLSMHYHQPISLDDVASAVYASRYHLSRVMNQQFGYGFYDYINQLRINDAKYRLWHTDERIADIALSCGFETIRSFNRVFLRLVRMPPRTYRDSQRRVDLT